MYEQVSINSFNLKRDAVLKYIVGFLSLVAFLVTYQLNVTSKHLVTAFDIKDHNMGIYLGKLVSFRTFFMILGFLIQFLADKYIKITNFMEYTTFISLCLVTLSRLIFLIFLYIPTNLSLQGYLILNTESLYCGFFQMSLFRSFPEYSSITMLCMFSLAIIVYLIQMSIECLPYYNPLLIIKTQFWFCVIISLLGVGLWIFYLFHLDNVLPEDYDEIQNEEFYLDLELLKEFQILQYYAEEKNHKKWVEVRDKLQKITTILPKIIESHSEMKLILNKNLSRKVLEKEKSNRENILEDSDYVKRKLDKIMVLINELVKIEEDKIKKIREIIKIITQKIKEAESFSNITRDGTVFNLEVERLRSQEFQNLEELETISHSELINEIKNLSESTEKLLDFDIFTISALESYISKMRGFAEELGILKINPVDESYEESRIWEINYSIGEFEEISKKLSDALETLKKIVEILKKNPEEGELKQNNLELLISSINEINDKIKELLEILINYSDSGDESQIFVNGKNKILTSLSGFEGMINKLLPQINSVKQCKIFLIIFLVKKTRNLISNINKAKEKVYTISRIRSDNVSDLKSDITSELVKNKKEEEKVKEINNTFDELEKKFDYIILKTKNFETVKKSGFFEELKIIISPFMMGIGASAIKDFLNPSIIPYALLERSDCHFINLISPLSYVIGSLTVFALDMFVEPFKEWAWHCNLVWLLIIPQLDILILAMLAIHSKVGIFKIIIGSSSWVLLLTMALLYFYTVMESTSYVAVANHVFYKTNSILNSLNIITFHNILTTLFHYFFLKLSVGYNATRVGLGIIYPLFQPFHQRNYTLCYLITETLKNTFRDIFFDFQLNIRQYT